MNAKYFVDFKKENFVDKHTTPVNPPPDDLPFESDLPEHSTRRNNIPVETPTNDESPDYSRNEDAESFLNKNEKTPNRPLKNSVLSV